ncbi:MAG: hypothetical protein ACJ71Z_13470 [Aeromicrobium sp.]
MISRRGALGGALAIGTVGTAGIVARRAGVLDDALQAVGLRPHTTPDPRDVALLADAAQGQRELLALVDQITQRDADAKLTEIQRVLREQLAAVSDDPETPASPYPTEVPTPLPSDTHDAVAALATRVDAVATARADGAVSAGSLAVTKVLATMSAGLDQVAVAVKELA